MKEDNNNMNNSEFKEFFVDELKDIYWAEKHLAKALPKLQKASTSDELAAAFKKHAQETEEHIKKVEQVFELMGEEPEEKKCEAMDGLLKEADTIIEDTEKDTFTGKSIFFSIFDNRIRFFQQTIHRFAFFLFRLFTHQLKYLFYFLYMLFGFLCMFFKSSSQFVAC